MSPVCVPVKNRPVKRRVSGFTLIELLVVIFIISILIAATLTIIPIVKRSVYGAQTSAQLAAIATAIQQYYNDYKSYPGPLPNNQLNWSYDSVSTNYPTAAGFPLAGSAPYAALPSGGANPYNPSTATTFGNNITGSQNLVLGLLGGLELHYTNGTTDGFIYNPLDILADGVAPSPRGPASLNSANPRRQQAYIQARPGDLSVPNINYNGGVGASFVDSTGDLKAADKRSPSDAMIPVFMDKYADPLPILYYRTNSGGTAIVGFRNLNNSNGIYVDDNGSTLVDTNVTSGPAQVPQYDLDQNLAYTTSLMATNLSRPTESLHGLQGCGTSANLSDPIDVKNADGTYTPFGVSPKTGNNGIAYFKDPTLNGVYDPSVSPPISNVHAGIPRQKDGFILISAGPDRLYGTHDDLINPGPLQP